MAVTNRSSAAPRKEVTANVSDRVQVRLYHNRRRYVKVIPLGSNCRKKWWICETRNGKEWVQRCLQQLVTLTNAARQVLDPKMVPKTITLHKFRTQKDIDKWVHGSDASTGGFSTSHFDLSMDGRGARFHGNMSLRVKPEFEGMYRGGYAGVKTRVSIMILFYSSTFIDICDRQDKVFLERSTIIYPCTTISAFECELDRPQIFVKAGI